MNNNTKHPPNNPPEWLYFRFFQGSPSKVIVRYVTGDLEVLKDSPEFERFMNLYKSGQVQQVNEKRCPDAISCVPPGTFPQPANHERPTVTYLGDGDNDRPFEAVTHYWQDKKGNAWAGRVISPQVTRTTWNGHPVHRATHVMFDVWYVEHEGGGECYEYHLPAHDFFSEDGYGTADAAQYQADLTAAALAAFASDDSDDGNGGAAAALVVMS